MHKLLTWSLSIQAVLCAVAPVGAQSESWRYYRPGNTGIQGDYNEALWIGPDGDPWIGGYDPSFEEGGFAKFVQAENRWINYSNVDHPAIGHPNETGTTRVSDIVVDAAGGMWMPTGHGALYFDPSVGPGSLVKFDETNSALGGGWTTDAEIAPDGTVWFAGYSTVWGAGSLARLDPATGIWTGWAPLGTRLSAQPKPGGGYYVWNGDGSSPYVQRFDSATQAWTLLPGTGATGEIVGLPGEDCTDDEGNFWALRATTPGNPPTLEYRRIDGTWVAPPLPFAGVSGQIWVLRAFGDRQALLVDGSSRTWRFDGTGWTDLGIWRPGAWTYAADVDAAGNVWVCGSGGAAKRDAQSGTWQRYRVTNTSQFDSFNADLTIDTSGAVYAGANAGPGIGGMVRFDGLRWEGWNAVTYDLGHAWPFPNDNCHALAARASTGGVAVSPTEWIYGVHEWTGAGFQTLMPSGGAERLCEDSLGRVWALGEYYSLQYLDAGGWHQVGITAWGSKLAPDPDRPGTVWAATGHEIKRTDGVYSFAKLLDEFPELNPQSDTFSGLAVDRDGVAWIGASLDLGAGGTGGALIRIDAESGAYQMWRYDQGWPLPGFYVSPLAVTHDGRVWMQYDTDYLTAQRGLCWFDGTNVGVYPAPPGGEPQWGGLPHAQIEDAEVRELPGGYELWLSCISRGIAVLAVEDPAPGTIYCSGDGSGPACPCGNQSPSGSQSGCLHSGGVGATLRATGTGSVAADDLLLAAADMPPNKNGLVFFGANPTSGTPFSSGLLCIASPVRRLAMQSSGPSGSFTYGPALVAYAASQYAPTFHFTPGSTWSFQAWFRDFQGGCPGKDTNTSNALTLQFLP